MALANIAYLIASNGHRVLLIDWDLEAPGMHRYFFPFLRDRELANTRGLFDLLLEYRDMVQTPEEFRPPSARNPLELADPRRFAEPLALDFERMYGQPGRLSLLAAGRQDEHYAERVNGFNWYDFYALQDGRKFVQQMCDVAREHYDFVIVDSRTGVSDTAGICTIEVPDVLVAFCTLNRQSIFGVERILSAIESKEPDVRATLSGPLRILPVVTRTDSNEKDRLDAARQLAHGRLGRFVSPDLNGETYWYDTEIPYEPWYSFEEVLTTLKERPGGPHGSVLRSLERLARIATDEWDLRMPPAKDDAAEALILKNLSAFAPEGSIDLGAPTGAARGEVADQPQPISRVAIGLAVALLVSLTLLSVQFFSERPRPTAPERPSTRDRALELLEEDAQVAIEEGVLTAQRLLRSGVSDPGLEQALATAIAERGRRLLADDRLEEASNELASVLERIRDVPAITEFQQELSKAASSRLQSTQVEQVTPSESEWVTTKDPIVRLRASHGTINRVWVKATEGAELQADLSLPSMSLTAAFSNLPDGAYPLRVEVSDRVTRALDLDPVTSEGRLLVDRTPPMLTVDIPLDGSFVSGRFEVAGTFIESNLASVTVNGAEADIDGEAGRWSATVELVDGAQQLFVRATDLAGQQSDVIQRNVTVDSQGPVIALTTPSSTSVVWGRPSLRIEGTVADAQLNSIRSIEVGGQTVLLMEGGGFEADLKIPSKDSVVTVTAIDPAGREGKATLKILYDLSPPKIRLELPEMVQAGESDVELDVEDDSRIEAVRVNGVAARRVDGTRWTARIEWGAETPFDVVVEAEDEWGNVDSLTRRVFVSPDILAWGDPGKELDPATRLPVRVVHRKTGIPLRLVQRGDFRMGASANDSQALDDERPSHEVVISRPFYLGETEVTRAQWSTLMPSVALTEGGDDSADEDAALPIAGVSWSEAKDFVQLAGLRLPSEAEWEYACRAGRSTRYSTGETLDGSQANIVVLSDLREMFPHMAEIYGFPEGLLPVKQFPPNRWGFYDMHGNVAEWCEDWYDSRAYEGRDQSGPTIDPVGPTAGVDRVLRGGSWSCDPDRARSSYRRSDASDLGADAATSVGVRVARDVFSLPRSSAPRPGEAAAPR